MRSFFLRILSLGIFFGITGCVTVQNPVTGRPESIMITAREEVSIGRAVAKEVARQMKFVRNPQWKKHIEAMGHKIAGASDRPNLPYHFHIVADKELNAFSLPGGGVYVNMGLVELTDEDELACVLAHEIGHIAARHSVKHMQTAMGYQWVLGLASAFGDVNANTRQITSVAFDIVQRGYSRQDELEADILAIRYAYWAGYDPEALLTILEKMEREMGGNPDALGTFLSTHPAISDRITHAEQEMDYFLQEQSP
ncbi:MAG: M48 family metalloprotease [Candidatus Omnitrophica bacterium]|nr:M48 family metalloprotease [Candidatus Omnitrophota bacterium]